MRRRRPFNSFDIYRTKLNRLHNTIDSSHNNYNKLHDYTVELKERVGLESIQLDQAEQAKGEQTRIVKRLTEVSKRARDEWAALHEKDQNLTDKVAKFDQVKQTHEKLESKAKDLSDLKTRLNEDQVREARNIQIKIDAFVKEKESYSNQIHAQEKHEVEAQKAREELQLENGDLKTKVEKIEDEISKIREEPGRLE